MCSLRAVLAIFGFVCFLNGIARSSSELPSQLSHEGTLKVAAASDLQFALKEIFQLFKGHTVSVTYGSSGHLAAQFQDQAPFDVFLSANPEYSKKLIQLGLATPNDEFYYAIGKIGLWTRADSNLHFEKPDMSILLDPKIRKIAIANPMHAPYGKAAEAALRATGIYGVIKNKLVFGENVSQAAQFVQSGAADVGILAMGLIMAPQMKQAGKYWEIPPSLYPRIEQVGVILKSAKGNSEVRLSTSSESLEIKKVAQEFKALLLSPASQKILKAYGFSIPIAKGRPER